MADQIFWELNPANAFGTVKDEIYGGFVEHLGRNVYGGVYDPGSPAADENGFRKDVLALIHELNTPITRYPGGCYTDLERWEDSIGPVRKARLDPAWYQLEPNTFGLDEFMKWSRLAKTEPLITINAANRSILDTLNLYEYCNFPSGTYWSDLRRANGIEQPYSIKNWCIGNELYGNWEMGQMDASGYGKCAREHCKLLKQLDPDCRTIVCGMPDNMQWNETTLELCGPFADVLSIHSCFFRTADATDEQYLRSVDRFEDGFVRTAAVCKDYEKRCGKRIAISVDEWIIWDFNRRLRPEEKWTAGMHLLEQDYTILEALIAGSFFSCLHRHAAEVDLACIAQSVNVIAPIRTEKDGTSWKQTIFYPFALTSRYGRGLSLIPKETGNDQKHLYGSAILREREKEITLFLTNRSPEEMIFSAEIPGACKILESKVMFCNDLKAVNASGKEVIQPVPLNAGLNGNLIAILPGFSWSMIRVAIH